MTTPKVSVIVPIYNQAGFIRETVESVLSQDHPNIELVLSDDGSTDGTSDVLREYAAGEPERVKLVASEENTGIAGAFNRALDAHTGDYVAWLGGDDVMLPGKLSRQIAALGLALRPSAVAMTLRSLTRSRAGRTAASRRCYNGRRGVRDGGVELLLDPGYLMLPSTMMVRSAAVGDLRFDRRVRVSNDWLFDIELFQRGRIVGIDDVLARYRRHQTQRHLPGVRHARGCAGGACGGRCPIPSAPSADPAAPSRRYLRRGKPALASW